MFAFLHRSMLAIFCLCLHATHAAHKHLEEDLASCQRLPIFKKKSGVRMLQLGSGTRQSRTEVSSPPPSSEPLPSPAPPSHSPPPSSNQTGASIFVCEQAFSCLARLPTWNSATPTLASKFQKKVFTFKKYLRYSAELQKTCVMESDISPNSLKVACAAFTSCLGHSAGADYLDFLKAISIRGTFKTIKKTGPHCVGNPIDMSSDCRCFQTMIAECQATAATRHLCLRAQMCRMNDVCDPWKSQANCSSTGMHEIVESLKMIALPTLIDSTHVSAQKANTSLVKSRLNSTERSLLARRATDLPLPTSLFSSSEIAQVSQVCNRDRVISLDTSINGKSTV